MAHKIKRERFKTIVSEHFDLYDEEIIKNAVQATPHGITLVHAYIAAINKEFRVHFVFESVEPNVLFAHCLDVYNALYGNT